MKYKIVQSTNKTAASNGKYIARVCHDNTVDLDLFATRIEHRCHISRDDIRGTLSAFAEELVRSLKEGDKVIVDDIGTFKIEMECIPVDAPEDFDPEKHVRRYQLHVIPEKKYGSKTLYEGIKLKQVQ